MSVARVGNDAVTRMVLHLPQLGVGWADVHLESTALLERAATTLVFESGLTVPCAVENAWLERGFAAITLRLGAGRLDQLVIQRDYQGIDVATVVRDTLRDVGETAGRINAPQILTQWVRTQQSAGAALTAVCRAVNIPWRMGLDGAVHVGQEIPRGALTLQASAWREPEFIVPLEPQLEPRSHNLTVRFDGNEYNGVPRSVRQVIWDSKLLTEVRL